MPAPFQTTRIPEDSALKIWNVFGALDDERKADAADILDRYRKQQEDYGEPVWPSQLQKAEADALRLRSMFGGFAEVDKVAPALADTLKFSPDPDKERAQTANIYFLAKRYGKSTDEVADALPFYRQDYAGRWNDPKAAGDDKLFYHRIGKELADEHQKRSNLEEASIEGAKAALRGDDMTASLSAWQLKAGLERVNDSSSFTTSYQKLRERATEFDQFSTDLLASLESNTGKTADDGKTRAEPASREQAGRFDEMLTQMANLTPGQRRIIYGMVSSKAEAKGYDQKGFFAQMLGELGKGIARVGGTVGTTATTAAIVAINTPLGLTADMPESFRAPERTPEQKADMEAAISLNEARGEIYDEISQVVASEIDPVKPVLSWLNDDIEKGLIQGPGAVLPFMAISAVASPLTAAAVFTADFAEQNRRDLRSMGYTPEQARNIGFAAAPLQAGAESLSNMLQLGRFPAVQKALSAFTKPIGGGAGLATRYLLNAGLSVGTEMTEEQLQDNFIVPAVQELVGALGQDVPEVPWAMYQNRAVQQTPELFFTIAPLALVFGGIMTAGQVNLSKGLVSDQLWLEYAGYDAAQASTIRTQPTEEARISKAQELWGSRAGTAASMETAAGKLAETQGKMRNDVQFRQQELERRGILPVMGRTEQGWRLTFTKDGSTADFGTHEQANAARWQYAEDQLGRVHAVTREALASLESNLAVNREIAVEFKPEARTAQNAVDEGADVGQMQRRVEQGKALGEVSPDEAFDAAVDLEKVTAQTDDYLSSLRILGSSKNEFKDGVLRTTIKLYEGFNPLTLVEEKLEGDAKQIVASKPGRAWLLSSLRNYEQESGDKLFRDVADDQLKDDDLAEAWSHLGQSYLLGRSTFGEPLQKKNLRRFLGLVMRSGLGGALNAESEFWRVVAARAQKLAEMKQAGKLSDDLVSELELQLGIDSQLKHETAVADAVAAEMVDTSGYSEESPGPNGETFSTSRATPADASNVVQMPDGARLVGPTTFSIRAFHGTPHKVDRFSLDKIGTGEGAQAYGWGLYFAEAKGVAEGYQSRIAGAQWVDKDGRSKSALEIGEAVYEQARKDGYSVKDADELRSYWSAYAQNGGMQNTQGIESIRAVVDGQGIKLKRSGNLYTVELLPDEADFLDWDKPLSEQSEKVRKAVGPLIHSRDTVKEREVAFAEYDAGTISKLELSKRLEEIPTRSIQQSDTGAAIYQRLWSSQTTNGREASEFLASIGIPGIRYLDGQSRDGGSGTSNFVIFDESLVKILEENGKPVGETFSLRKFPVPPGLAEAAQKARGESSLILAYQAAQRGSSSAMVPIRAVYEQAKKHSPALTPAQFMAQINALNESGSVLIGLSETTKAVDEAGAFRVGAAGTEMAFAPQETFSLAKPSPGGLSEAEVIGQILSIAESEIGQDIGIRALHEDETPKVGDILPESFHWEDDVRSNDSIGGTAAFDANHFTEALKYFGRSPGRYAILSGQDIGSRGMPERGARAFKEAEVVAVIDATKSPISISANEAILSKSSFQSDSRSGSAADYAAPNWPEKTNQQGPNTGGQGANKPSSPEVNPESSRAAGGTLAMGKPASITPAQDAEYMAAVESGDVAKQQAMVDAAAKAAGYDIGPVWHFTNANFDTFDPGERRMVYFNEREDAARAAQLGGTKRAVRAFLRASNPFNSKANPIYHGDAEANFIAKIPQAQSHVISAAQSFIEYGDNPTVEALSDIYPEESPEDIEASIRVAKGEKVQRREVKTVFETTGTDLAYVSDEGGISIAVPNPNQIKSADPVTRDESGQIIPLSQRFNPERNEITFSLRSGDFASRMAAAFSPFQRNPELRMAIAQVAKQRAQKLGAEWIEKAAALRSASSITGESRVREALAYEARMNEYLDGLTPNARQTLEFEPASLEDDPLISAMLDFGKLMSRSTAIKNGVQNMDEFEGAPWLPPAWYSKGSGITPGKMAKAMHEGPRGEGGPLSAGDSAQDLWEALGQIIASTKKNKAAHREAVQAYKAAQRAARADAKLEAEAWANQTRKAAGSPKAQRDMLKAALRTLDGILSAAPPEVRARVGGYVKLAGLATDEAMLQEIERRIAKLNVELEKWLKKEGVAEIQKLLKRGRPDAKSGKRGKGKDADMHALFAAAERAIPMTAEAVAGELARLDALIGGDALTPEQEALAITERGIVELAGDLKSADSGRVFSALDSLREIYEGGWLKWKLAQIEKREERAGMRGDFIADTGKSGVKPERDAADKAAVTLLGKIKGGFLSLSSFHEVLAYAFGSKSDRVKALVDAEREASGQYEDVTQSLADEVESLFSELAGGSVLAGERLRFDMSQRTIQTGKGDLSQLEAIQALLMWRQEDGRRHMEGAMDENGKPIGPWNYDQAWIDEITAALTPEARSVMAWLSQKYAAEHPALNALYRERYGVNMPAHDNYAPITVQPVQTKSGEVNDPVSGAAISSGSVLVPGSLRARSRSAIAEPDFRDSLQTFMAHTRQLEYWKAYYDLAFEASAILGNREVLNAVKAKGGEPAATALRKWIDAIAQGGFRDASATLGLHKLLSRMTGRAASVGLLGRFSTLLVQSTQLGAASVKMPVGAYLVRLSKLLTGNLSFRDAVNSPFIQRRYKSAPPIVRQALEGLGVAFRPNQITRATRHLGNLLSGADAMFTAGTYAMLLDYHRGTGQALGLSGAELETHAHTEAERDTEAVAQPTRMATRSLAELTSTNPLAKVSWAYASEARQKIALMAWATMKATAEPAQFAKTAFLVFGVGGLMTQILKNLWREAKGDDDEKKWSPERLALSAMAGPLHGVPLASELMGNQGMLSGVAWAWPALKDIASGEGDMRDIDILLSAAGLFNDTAAGVAALSHVGLDAAKLLSNLASEK